MDNKLIFNNLNDYLNQLEICTKYLNEGTQKNNFKVRINDIRNRIKDPKIKIGFWSFFSAGKSSIINNLINSKILPVGEKTTTSIATTIGYGERENVEVILKDKNNFKKVLEQKITELNKISSENINKTYYSKELSEKLSKTNYFNKEEKNFLNNFNNKFKNNFNDYINSKDNKNIAYRLPREYNSEASKIVKNKIDEINLMIDIYCGDLSVNKVKDLQENLFNYSNEIEELIITTNKWDFNKNIQILDLPGFGSSNKNHMAVALEKLQNMNAFVFIESETLIEGECKREILNLKKQFPEIFKNSYFIKNKMSLIKSDTVKNFNEKMKVFENLTNELGINKNRIFKIDALKEIDGKKCEFYNNFIEFRKKLIEDSDKTMLEEFVNNSLNSLEDIKNEIIKSINKKIEDIGITNDNKSDGYLKGIILKKKIKTECDNFKENLENVLEEINNIYNQKKVDEEIENNSNVSNEIINVINSNKKYILRNANSKKDIHYFSYSSLAETIINTIELNELIRKKYELIIKKNFYDEFQQKIKQKFNNSLLEFLPQKEKNNLMNLLNKNVSERLNGAIDIILLDYSDNIDTIRLKAKILFNIITRKNSRKPLEELKANSSFLKDLNITNGTSEEEVLKTIKKIYNIQEDNIKTNVLSCIFSKEMNDYVNLDIKNKMKNYTLAIIKNYIKDTIKEIRKILNFNNFEAEFQQNVEEKIIKEIDRDVENMKKEKEIYENEIKKINKLKNDILNNLK